MTLPIADFAYNKAIHRIMGKSLFSLVYTKDPNHLVDVSSILRPPKGNPQAIDFVEQAQAVVDVVRNRLEEAYNKEKACTNEHRRAQIFQLGEEVMVHFRRERMPINMGDKLQARKFGPYKILMRIIDNVHMVDLSKEFGMS